MDDEEEEEEEDQAMDDEEEEEEEEEEQQEDDQNMNRPNTFSVPRHIIRRQVKSRADKDRQILNKYERMFQDIAPVTDAIADLYSIELVDSSVFGGNINGKRQTLEQKKLTQMADMKLLWLWPKHRQPT
eukprot:362596_1